MEQKTADWLAQNVKNSIISTGGGFYKVKNLKDIGTIVYLQADFDWIYDRITKSKNAKKKIKKRPLFKSYKEAKALYNQRVKEYESVADITINVENKKTEEIIQELLAAIKLS